MPYGDIYISVNTDPGNGLLPVTSSHYLNQCWLFFCECLWYFPDSNFTIIAQATMLYLSITIILLKQLPHLPGVNELNAFKKKHLMKGTVFFNWMHLFEHQKRLIAEHIAIHFLMQYHDFWHQGSTNNFQVSITGWLTMIMGIINSLQSGDDVRYHRSGSTLVNSLAPGRFEQKFR